MRRSLPLLLCLLSLLPSHRAPAGISLDELVVSPAAALDVWTAGGVEALVRDGSVLRYAGTAPSLVSLGLPGGLASPTGPGVSALHVEPGGDVLFAIDSAAFVGGILVSPSDVVRFDGSTYSIHFDGSARGIPPEAHVDAFSRRDGDDLISFDFEVFLGPLVAFPEDVIRFGSGPPQLEFDADQAGVFSGNVDALAALDDGTLMLSFEQTAAVGDISAAPSSTVRYNPQTGAWTEEVVLADFDPDWGATGVDALHAVLGLAQVDTPRPAEITMLVIEPEPPRSYELRLDCGSHAVERIDVGLVLGPSASPSSVTIGDCTTTACPGVSGFGPDVDPGSVDVDFPPHLFRLGRSDTVYVQLDGTPRLCTPGQETLLADVTIRGDTGPLPAPAPTGEGAGASLREGGSQLAAVQIAHATRQSGAPGWTVLVRPRGETGLQHELLLEGPLQLSRIGLALLLPATVTAAQVSFGGCELPAGPLEARSCAGAKRLGPYVDRAASSTLGPSTAITTLQGLPGAIYLDLVGALPTAQLPALNSATRRSLLGILSYDPSVPVAGRLRPIVLHAGAGPLDQALPSTNDLAAVPRDPIEGPDGPSQPFEGPCCCEAACDDPDPDPDEDSCAGDCDPCPYYEQTGDYWADADLNEIGDQCECGDQTSDGTVAITDLLAINGVIFGLEAPTPLCDTNLDDGCDVVDILGANAKIFGTPAFCSRYPQPAP